MKNKDLRIISYLRKNARMPLTKMSRKTHIPVSTLFDRLKVNEDGLIVKHTSLLDFTKLGYMTKANVAVKVDREDKEALREYLTKHPNINSVYKINNGYDFMIEAVFKKMLELEDFLELMESEFKIEDRKTFFIIEDVKREGFMSEPELITV